MAALLIMECGWVGGWSKVSTDGKVESEKREQFVTGQEETYTGWPNVNKGYRLWDLDSENP